MAKVMDITDKLDFDSNPRIVIKGNEYEVNADAESVLKIMGILGSEEGSSPKAVADAYEIMFSEKERKAISKLKLQFADFQKVVESAIDLIVGADEEEGE